MKLGLDKTALRAALYARLSQLASPDPSDEFAKALAEVIAEATDLNNRTLQRQLETAGVKFRD